MDLPKMGQKVRTNATLGDTIGFMIAPRHLSARKANTEGTYQGFVPGHRGDVWWVKHGPEDMAAYAYTELGIVGEPNQATAPEGSIETQLAFYKDLVQSWVESHGERKAERDAALAELAELKARRGPAWSAIDRLLSPFGFAPGMAGLMALVVAYEKITEGKRGDRPEGGIVKGPHRLTLDLTPAAWARLDRLKESTEYGTKVGVIQAALQLMEFALAVRRRLGTQHKARLGKSRRNA